MKRRSVGIRVALLAFCVGVPRASAIQPSASAVAEKAFRHPALDVQEQNEPAGAVTTLAPAIREAELAGLGATAAQAFFDSRTGRWSSLVLARPMLPGPGIGNRLSWIAGRPPASDAEHREAAAAAVLAFVRGQAALRIDPAQIASTPRAAVLSGGNLVYVHIPRIVEGIRVRGNAITAAINHGNLVLLGLSNWGDVDASLVPAIAASQAETLADAFLAPFRAEGRPKRPRLELVPADGGDSLSYRLAWVIESRVAGDVGRWETLVDAKTGEILAFEDLVQYAQRQVVGGVFPVSNDGSGPEGTEQPGWPMPWADVVSAEGTSYTDGGGNAGCIPGSISTTLSGRFVKILDTCGAIDETSAGNIDLGVSGGTDCTVPGGHSAGDTHSARSGFYELNRMKEQARGQLPNNTWLQQQLPANMNIALNCNATWNGTSVDFYRSGSGCGNTGEIAAVFDHEWGHGMDNNGVDPSISSPGESIADIYAALRLNTSCIGRAFFLAGTCSGYGDPCDTCTGIRDIDWDLHVSGSPHGIDWIAVNCPSSGQRGPCNRETHCEGVIVAEVAWDLATRDLTAAPFNYGTELAREVATRLFYLGSQPVANWYTCVANGGCGATGGYLNILAADDDNGSLADGTPHMTAIFAAFNRHQIACAVPAPVDSGCAGAPAGAPVVTVQAADRGAALTWTAVPNASAYAVFRTEGVAGCEFGKIKVAETGETAFFEEGLQNGRTYYYSVLPLGATDACFGPMSVCSSVAPAPGPNLGVASSLPAVAGGDGDPFLDNCEAASAAFDVANTGSVPQTNVRIVAVEPLTHPSTIVLSALPIAVAANLDECDTAAASIQLQAQGLAFDETSEVRVTLSSDQLDALGRTRTVALRFESVESDLLPPGSHTYSFESDLENWKVVSGTFARITPGGANGTSAHVSSSESAAFACDVIRSPLIRIGSGVSTLSMYERYEIEPTSDAVYDRANVSVFDPSSGKSAVIVTSSGQAYTGGSLVPGPCAVDLEPGWNGTNPGNPAFVTSGWSSGALSPGGIFDGRLVRIEVAYATDFIFSLAGLDFDEVALTNVEVQAPDAQSDVCATGGSVLPQLLHVDTAGNGVLDVGEAAAIEPGWANPGAGPVALTGVLSNFTGPAGPDYTIDDASADYGSIPGPGAASCADCYSLSIAAATRPAAHWDASVLETVSGGSPSKTWTLHVGGSFPDVASASPFYPFVENVLHNGVAAGCGGGLYCPASTVTRQQMAVFLLKSREGPGYEPPDCVAPAFPDVPCDSPFAPWINELVSRGVTAGCGGGFYCPTNPTTRQQMAVFLLKTEEGSAYLPPACAVAQFGDVPCSSPFAPWINELVSRGITAGCGGGLYCPSNSVLRQQMAVFLVGTFGLRLYGL